MMMLPIAVVLCAHGAAPSSAAVTNTDALSQYQSLLVNYPVVTHLVQAGVSSGLAKLTAQKLSGGSYEMRKVLNAAAISALFVSPTMTYAYGVLLPWAKRHGGAAAFWACDQLVVPLFLNFTIMFFNFYLSARVAATAAVLAVFEKLPKAMVSGWCFWVPARALMVRFLPAHVHQSTGQLINFLWSIILQIQIAAIRTSRAQKSL